MRLNKDDHDTVDTLTSGHNCTNLQICTSNTSTTLSALSHTSDILTIVWLDEPNVGSHTILLRVGRLDLGHAKHKN